MQLFSLKNSNFPGKPLILHDEPIFLDDKIVGYTTSSNYSFCYKKNICLAYVNNNNNKNLNNFSVEIEGKKYALKLEIEAIHDPKYKILRA